MALLLFVGLLALSPLVLALLEVIYNLFFHPLRNFPGPLGLRASRLVYIRALLSGHMPQDILAMHQKYGPVVRVAPWYLSFLDPVAWKDIYGRRNDLQHDANELPKDPVFYRIIPGEPSIIAENRQNHALLRKLLAHGFSEKALREQEPIIRSYVDLLIKQLRAHCIVEAYKDEEEAENDEKTKNDNEKSKENGQSESEKNEETDEKTKNEEINNEETKTEETKTKEAKTKETNNQYAPLDMRAWYNWTTFDIIGDLAMGEPFGCLAMAAYHPWVHTINNTMKMGGYLFAVKILHLMGLLLPVMARLSPSLERHRAVGIEKMQRRMAMKLERPDFVEMLLQKRQEWHLSVERVANTGGLLVLAGSETSATLLTGLTYLLLRHPKCLSRLVDEIRSSFASEDDITFVSASSSRLPYLAACIDEGLRMYPPAPSGMPRITPRGGAEIAGVFVPEGQSVAIWQWAMNRNPNYWTEPDVFNPDRFLEGNPTGKNDRRDAWQPFSAGPRNCIGQNLAQAEIRHILARILYNFDLELVDTETNWLDQTVYTLWLKPELNVYLKPVKR